MIRDEMSYSLPLMVACNCKDEVQLVIGTNSMGTCKNRIKSILRSGAHAVVVSPTQESDVKQLVSTFGHNSRFRLVDRQWQLSDLTSLGRSIVAKVVDRVFVQLPLDECLMGKEIYEQCIKLRIPINVFQRPEWSTFHVGSTYVDPQSSGLQISVSTNGQGCILANRIKREIIASLPSNISQIVTNMGQLRDRIINEDQQKLIKDHYNSTKDLALAQNVWYGLNGEYESHNLNNLVKEFDMTERDQRLKRTRWLSQIIEYYPMSKLAEVSLEDLGGPSDEQQEQKQQCGAKDKLNKSESTENDINSQESVVMEERKSQSSCGKISLVGGGPGSVSMLTLGALQEIKTADIILADKLVPQSVLDLIPEGTETFIARKFPGNAERAQQELLEKGLHSLREGRKVVRLKQGDPYIFGRGGEEYVFFSERGYEPTVLPGLSSALASTVAARVPATQRDVADQILVCTGTGRKGALPQIPEYVASRTTVFLMALHRVDILVRELLAHSWDSEVPAAIVERASCHDQRITRTLLKYVPEVVEEIGSRPPGLLIVGRSVAALVQPPLRTFDDSNKYAVEEGFQGTDVGLAALLK